MSLPPPTSTFEGRLRRESRVNVTTGKNWIPDQVRNDKVGIFGLFTSPSILESGNVNITFSLFIIFLDTAKIIV